MGEDSSSNQHATWPRDPRVYINAIRKSDSYLEYGLGEVDPKQRDRKALAKVALGHIEQQRERSEYLNGDALAIGVIGSLDSFMRSQRAIDEHRNPYSSARLEPHEYDRALEQVNRYNHILREIIDSQQQATINTIQNFVNFSAVLMGWNKQDVEFAKNRTHSTLVGMQAEVFTEQALWSINGVDIPVLSNQERIKLDRKGVDIRFTYDGITHDVDVKNKGAYEDAIRKRAQQPHRHYSSELFWPGHSESNSFRAEPKELEIIRERLMSQFNLYKGARGVLRVAK